MYYILGKHVCTLDLFVVLLLKKLSFLFYKSQQYSDYFISLFQDFGQSVDDFVKKLVEVLKECDDYDIKIKIVCVSSPMLAAVGELNISLILKKFKAVE